MAWAGWGAYSYVVPLAMQALFESALGLWLVRRTESIRPVLRRESVVDAFKESGWLMMGSAALALATSGDYLAISLLESPATVGQYFFAFQLVMAVGIVVTGGLEAILPGVVSRLDADPARLSGALLRLTEVALHVALPVAAALHICGPWLVDVLWQGRWHFATDAISVLALCIPAWVIMSIVRAVLEGRGQWQRRFALLLAYGAGAVSASYLGARLGSLDHIVRSVTSFYVIFGISLVILLSAMLRVPLLNMTRAIYPPILFALLSVVVATKSPVVGLVILAASSLLLLKGRISQIRSVFLQRKSL
jgi:O-antigen/teichoic acid export membrane protein